MIDEKVALVFAVLAVLPILLISVFALFSGRNTPEEGPPREQKASKPAAPKREAGKQTAGTGR